MQEKKSAGSVTNVPDKATPSPLSPPGPPAHITLNAELASIIGGPVGTAGYLRITLCGFGPVIPIVPPGGGSFQGVLLADAGIPQIVGPQVGTTVISVLLYGNDQISPSGTFYEVAVLDQNKNVIQCGMYQFTGPLGTTFDLSATPQIVAPYGFLLSALHYAHCSGVIPGTVYTAPGLPIAVSYNGIFMIPGLSLPALSYTVSGNVITLNFSTQAGDRGIDALCIY